MPFDLAMVKKHPYATGGVVIAGALIVFYILSKNSGGSTAVTTGSPNADYYNAQSAIGQAQAAAAIQTNAQAVALQTAQINASAANHQTDVSANVANTQTLANLVATLNTNKNSLEVVQSNNDAATAQLKATLDNQAAIYSTQEQGLLAQINQAEQENANNNATSLAALQSQLAYNQHVADITVNSAYSLASQSEADYESNVQAIIPNVGKKYNSALDANNANAAYLTILSGGNPGVAASGVQSSAGVANSAALQNASNVASVTNGISRLISAVF